eukprot:TRINITY_DN98603_c0_g1_i1.p1 TRINITY_DN98603_c0_g1~~TRINITY_DN98603_c0_g1_i1.p1  ORF type:complete len:241 (+),score=32.40 TRINITY_DN98603_c0_g1_i1:50-724(+)
MRLDARMCHRLLRGWTWKHMVAVTVVCLFLRSWSTALSDGKARVHSNKRKCDLDSYSKPVDILELDLKSCDLTALPASISRFTRLGKLDVSNNKLSTLPRLPASLEIFFALGNDFQVIPHSVAELPRLRMLSFKSNRLQRIGVPLPKSLVWLILTDNVLTELPSQLGELSGMRKLMLSNNRLTKLPAAMANMQQLELLRLANNDLQQLPDFIFALPALTWLAVA